MESIQRMRTGEKGGGIGGKKRTRRDPVVDYCAGSSNEAGFIRTGENTKCGSRRDRYPGSAVWRAVPQSSGENAGNRYA